MWHKLLKDIESIEDFFKIIYICVLIEVNHYRENDVMMEERKNYLVEHLLYARYIKHSLDYYFSQL